MDAWIGYGYVFSFRDHGNSMGSRGNSQGRQVPGQRGARWMGGRANFRMPRARPAVRCLPMEPFKGKIGQNIEEYVLDFLDF